MSDSQAMAPYERVKQRTMELENIHNTSVLLRKVRQFQHDKATLDQQLLVAFEDKRCQCEPELHYRTLFVLQYVWRRPEVVNRIRC
jgi:hypothetical protein